MNLFYDIAKKIPQFVELTENLKSNNTPTLIVGVSDVQKAHCIYSAFCQNNNNILVITPDETSGATLVDDINSMNNDNKEIAYFYPAREFALRQLDVISRDFEHIRLGVLSKILNNEAKIIVSSVEAALQYTIPKNVLIDSQFAINQDSSYKIEDIIKNLVMMGYERREQVDGVAQFALRGGIIDIFPTSKNEPVRIEMWGDSIDTISYFDVETQRRTDNINYVMITPAYEILFKDNDTLKKKIQLLIDDTKNTKVKEVYQKDLEQLDASLALYSYDRYMALAYDERFSLFDYLDDATLFISEYQNIKNKAKTYEWHEKEDIKILLESYQITKPLICFNMTLNTFLSKIKKYNSCFLDIFARSNHDIDFKSMISLNSIQTATFSSDLKILSEDITPLIEESYCVFILAGSKKAAHILVSDLNNINIPSIYSNDISNILYGKVVVFPISLSSGFEYNNMKVSVIAVGKKDIAKNKKRKFDKNKHLKSITDLNVGDFIVHISHGIGIFEGINTLDMQGIVKDYIKIRYAGTDMLYVPVTQLDLVSKYIGPRDDGKVKLNKLHSVQWNKTKNQVKKAVEEMAEELIILYARRMDAKGYAFSQDTEWQKDFEQRFQFTETDDQLRCVEEIKIDMEKQSPMDRVLCGDVGFGKTEVAMRACFKATMDSKQVAVLCPTTILAWQHFESFSKRFAGFPIRIEVLSRFKTPKQQKEIINLLSKGVIDIIIGTHRLIQKDIKFKDLGLAIIDEEQRFGVKHKEVFKEMFCNIDILNLSATPIPRTLNMAISGIRDMSTIDQPPQNRHPVQTYVLELDMDVIGEAIKREMRRGGQVYYIHNHIETMHACVSRIKTYVPEAIIACAHGGMDEQELSKIWQQLLEKEIDVLVCTTIIETGVDVANCNTLIIENADRMGLSQLYQLRGRVGRSNRRAFAYFTFLRGKVLSEIATKRLEAIREFTKFGSGFHIAMRDLEIRGSGNILGEKQHGHMEAVGYEMYIRLLSEAVSIKKGEKLNTKTFECNIDIRISAHIPDEYISEGYTRIDIYKKISSINSLDDKFDIIDELIDRFGELPQSVVSLIEVGYLRNMLSNFGFIEINQKPNGIVLVPVEINMSIAERMVKELDYDVLFNAGQKPYFIIKPKSAKSVEPISILQDVVTVLKNIIL